MISLKKFHSGPLPFRYQLSLSTILKDFQAKVRELLYAEAKTPWLAAKSSLLEKCNLPINH